MGAGWFAKQVKLTKNSYFLAGQKRQIHFTFTLFNFVQDEDLKWVEDNIPTSLTDV